MAVAALQGWGPSSPCHSSPIRPTCTHLYTSTPAPPQGADLVVDGMVASAHSNWMLDRITPAPLRWALPAVYEAILTPVYALYRLVGPRTAEWLAHGPLNLVSSVRADSSAASYLAFCSALAAPPALLAVVALLAVASRLQQQGPSAPPPATTSAPAPSITSGGAAAAEHKSKPVAHQRRPVAVRQH
jgi:hypothetical protein